jgi:hypothetical protein
MKLKIYKSSLFVLMGLLTGHLTGFAQDVSVSVTTQPVNVSVKTKLNDKDFQVTMNEFGKNLKVGLKDLGKNLSYSLSEITPQITNELKNLNINIDLGDLGNNFNPDSANDDFGTNIENVQRAEKIKSYSKSYPVDGNDRIRLSNQFGKITVNTWDRHEVKVDIQIKAEARDDNDAQKLLDAVQINDSKNGDEISFKTEIGHNNNGAWNIFNWGGNNKVHKITVNYIVYMPAKTDLNVEQSYGSIQLPELAGRVKINSSYSSVTVQSLTNSSNDIDVSYGNLHAGLINGSRLNSSYSDVAMDECNNIKADLSYGSFRLGRLKNIADLSLSYVGGFRIGELASSFKRLNINSDYSAMQLRIAGSNNFDFDVTTTYAAFGYNDEKVTITSKTPADGSKRSYSSTKNYKGHFGKEGSEAQVNIHSTYGAVSFE